MWKSSVCERGDRLVISSRIHRGKERVTNTYHSIQLVGEIVERSSRTARLTGLNMSDGKCLMNVRMKSRI